MSSTFPQQPDGSGNLDDSSCGLGGGGQDWAGPGQRPLMEAWSALREKQAEFDRRSEQLDVIRQRLQNFQVHEPLPAALMPPRSQSDTLFSWPAPPPPAPPAGRSNDGRFAAALVVGFVAAGVLCMFTAFTYQIDLEIKGDPLAIDETSLQAARAGLNDALADWHSGNRPPWLDAVSAVSVHPAARALRVNVVASDRKQGETSLLEFARAHLQRHEQQSEQQRATLTAAAAELEQELAAARAEAELLERSMEQQRQLAAADSALGRYQSLEEQLAAARTALRALKDEERQIEIRLDDLQRTQIPDLPAVDAATRQQAEIQDTALQADMAELDSRLYQLRSHILAAFRDAAAPLQAHAEAAQSLSAFLSQAMASTELRKIGATLDELSRHAEDMLEHVLGFARTWQQNHHALEQMTNPAQQRGCLELHQRLEQLVRDFNEECKRHQATLQEQYDAFQSGPGSAAEYFQLRSDFVERIREVAAAQKRFEGASLRLLPQKDFQIDALRKTAVGLAGRVRQRQQELEHDLARGQHALLIQELESRLREAQTRLIALRDEQDVLLEQKDAIELEKNQLVPEMLAQTAATTGLQYTQADADALAARITALETQHEATQREVDRLQRAAGAWRVEALRTADWPTNLTTRLSVIGFGSVLAILAAHTVIGLLSLIGQTVRSALPRREARAHNQRPAATPS